MALQEHKVKFEDGEFSEQCWANVAVNTESLSCTTQAETPSGLCQRHYEQIVGVNHESK